RDRAGYAGRPYKAVDVETAAGGHARDRRRGGSRDDADRGLGEGQGGLDFEQRAERGRVAEERAQRVGGGQRIDDATGHATSNIEEHRFMLALEADDQLPGRL